VAARKQQITDKQLWYSI